MNRKFRAMAPLLSEGQSGIAVLEHFEVSEQDSRFTALRPREFVPAGRYARLRVNGGIMMSDTRMEQVSNFDILRNANGNVLIAGLGIGMILLPILASETVQAVTVVEKHVDVIRLVEQPVRDASGRDARKLSIVHADIFQWLPEKRGRQFNTIYFDIWPDICTDNLDQMKVLRRKFAPYLVKGGWASCWMQEELRDRRRQGW